MSAWSWTWIFWALSFAAVEIPAVVLNEKYDAEGKPRELRTLSENLRWLFATDKAGARARWRGVRRTVLLAGLAWLAAHLLTGFA
jgi:hypothetical protein